MLSFNSVVLMGFATRDPDFLHTTHGTPLCNLGMAINRKYKDDSGQEKQDTAFVDVTVWRRLAEIANEYVHKGDPVFIQGRLKTDMWDDKQTSAAEEFLRGSKGLRL